ncbi:hypothetical protein FO519_002696 [Halicephalobus sp. NKZ332]|nr:hypothetical protein FO519_002696 [Halicephalobus sp. NKZ332]
MFRKPKNKNIRQRQREGAGNEEDDKSPVRAAVNEPKVTQIEDSGDEDESNSIKINPAPKKGVQLFSFDQDEGNDTEEFKIKKPSHKKRAEKLLKRQKEYEKRQKELEETRKSSVEQEFGIVVKNPIVGRSKSEEEEPEIIEDDQVIIDAIHNDGEVSSNFYSIEGIPDAKTVFEAKKRREQMRRDGTKSKLNEDSSFIPVSNPEKVVRSRLIREDDFDESDEEENGEFYSSKKLLITEEERRRQEQEQLLGIDGESEEDEEKEMDEEARKRAQESDEEFAEWERHQIRKGVSSQKVKQLQRETYAVTNEKPPPETDVITLDEDMDIEIIDDIPAVVKNIPSASQLKLADIIGKIEIRIEDKQNFISAQQYDVERKENTVEDNTKAITGIDADYSGLKEKYRLYQEMKLYTKDLLDCINEKLDTVVDMENRILAMWKMRSERLMKRRRMDYLDQYNKCTALSKSRTWQPSGEAAQRETQRESRRSYRRIQREKAGIQGDHNEGLSSDEDEPESQQYEYNRTIAESLEVAALVFHDAAEEFSDVGLIISKFADWILIDQKSFDDAYVSICLPKLLSPFIRLELLDWNPLRDVSRPFFEFNWYKRLLTAGTDKVGFDLENPTIVNLIPSIIDKLFFPRLTKVINEQWDPFSLSQSRNLSYMIKQFVDESPSLNSESKSVNNLLKAIFQKFQGAIAEDSDFPLFGQEALQNNSTGCAVLYEKCFDVENLIVEKTNAKKMIDSILDGFKQILAKRQGLPSDQREEFDKRIDPIKRQTQATINAIMSLIEKPLPETKRENIFDDCFIDERDAYGGISSSTSKSTYEKEFLDQTQSTIEKHRDDLRFKLTKAKEDAEATARLARDIEDLNQVMEDLATLVHCQHDMVDSIEEHIEMTTHHVHEGNQQLKKALASKNAQVPLAAAAVGATAAGGPVGFAAGSVVLGTVAAVGGAVAGLFGGRWIKKSVQESTKVTTSDPDD